MMVRVGVFEHVDDAQGLENVSMKIVKGMDGCG